MRCLFNLNIVVFIFLTSCSPICYSTDQAQPIPTFSRPKNPVRVAVVLGGGGSRALAHVGVLEVLEKADIPVQLIVGCSGGAIVGALYADWPDASEVKEQLYHLRKKDLLDIHYLDGRFGPVHGRHLHHFLRKHMRSRYFEELQIPFIAVATDLFSGEFIKFGSGPIIPAVCASSAIPGLFRPVKAYGRYLVDGGAIDPIPVQTAKEYGADIVIAVDIGESLQEIPICSFFDVSIQSMNICLMQLSDLCARDADVLIKPHFKGLGMFSDAYNCEIYNAGRFAALDALHKIKKIIQEKDCTKL